MRMRFTLVFVLALVSCTQSGNLLEIPPVPLASHYDVFWLNPTVKLEGQLCNSYFGEIDTSAQYFARIADTEQGTSPQALPPDYQNYGLSLLVNNSQPVRAIIVLLSEKTDKSGYTVVGIGDSVTPITVSNDLVHRHSIKITPMSADSSAEYVRATNQQAIFPSALRWHVSPKAELRISAFANPLDFDGDTATAVLGDGCPRKALANAGDCDDVAAQIHPQADATCGMEADVDCRYDEKDASLCATPAVASFCEIGSKNCSDEQSGDCKRGFLGAEINAQAPACQSTPVLKRFKCDVRFGANCSVAQPVAALAQWATSQQCSLWYRNANVDIVVSGTVAALPPAIDSPEMECAVVLTLLEPRNPHSSIAKMLAVADRKKDSAEVALFEFNPIPCDAVQPTAGVYCN